MSVLEERLTAERERNRLRNAAWRASNPGRAAAHQKRWRERHPEEYLASRQAHEKANKLRYRLSALVYNAFKRKGWGKTTKTQALLGCTFEEFAAHLQSKFKEGMTFENHGDWHIDHIKPCATATSAEELAALFHFTNLQPLWATENLSKGCKYHE